MAKKPSFTQQKLPSLGVSKPAKPAKPAKAKPSRGRPAPLVALHERYGLVYDPESELDPIIKSEREALNELYRGRTGRDIGDEPDTRAALESAGFLKPTVSRKRAKELRGPSDVFASALDALDAFKPRLSEGAIGRGVEALGDVREAVAETRLPVVGLPAGPAAAAQAKAPTIGEIAGGAADVAGKALLFGGADATLGALPTARRGIEDYRRRVLEKNPELGKEKPPGIDVVTRGIGQIRPVGLFGTATKLISPEDPTVRGAAAEIKRQQQEFATGKGTNQLPIEQQVRVAESVVAGITDEQTLAGELAYNEMLAAGMPVADAEYARGLLRLGPLDPGRREVYLKWARENGWNIADPQKYTDSELAKMALTKPGFRIPGTEFDVDEATRSYFRQIGEFAAAPMAIPAILSAVTSGDREQQMAIIEGAIAPYTYLKDDIRRRGLGPALTSFAQERPLDFILIANSLWRGLGRGAGAAARTYGGTGTGYLQMLVRPAEGGLRRRVGEFARVDRPIAVPVPRVERAPGQANLEPVAITFTNKNLADTLVNELYALGIRAGMKVPGRVGKRARYFAGRRTQRAMRRANNMADDAAARATIDLREATRSLNSAQLLRMALELTVARIRPDAGEYFFSQRAEFFRELANDALRKAEENPKKSRQFRADAKRFFDQADLYQRVNDTPLDRGLIDQVREIAREVGGDNDTIISMLMGAYDEIDNPSGLQRTSVRYAELNVGDRIDIGSPGKPVPAVVTAIERLADGRLSVTRRSVIDPRDELSIPVLGSQRVDRLRPGVNAAKYTRQMIEWEGMIDELAKEQQAAINVPRRLAAQEANRPLRRIQTLDARRRALRSEIERLLGEVAEARAAGQLARARSRQRLVDNKVRRLLRTLREMQRIADAEDLPATVRTPDGGVREVRLADEIERQRREIITQRGIEGRAPFRVERVTEETNEVVPGGNVSPPPPGALWNEVEGRDRYAADWRGRSGWDSVEYVLASELRGMEGNAVDAKKVESLRGQDYENPIIVDYDPRTGLAYISEGNHRVAAATDDQFVPVRVIVGKVDPRRADRTRKITDENVMFDETGYVPSNLYPHELGFTVRATKTTQRQIGSRVSELPGDVEFMRQTRLARAIEGGETAPAALRQVQQPEARRLAEQAQRLDARAAELRRLEQRLLDERAAAPSAAQARRAEVEIERVREEAASLERQAAESSQVPRGLEEVFDELKARLEFIGDRRILSSSIRTQRAFNEKTRASRIRAARELADIRRKVLRNGRFTPEDIDALERVESVILGAEKTLGGYKAFANRPRGVTRLPDGFGVRSARSRIGGVETAPRAVLRAEAAGRRERELTLAERIREQRAAPAFEGPVSIRSVRRERKRLEKEAQKNRREAARIIERGRPVANNGLIRAVVDATSDDVAFEIQLQKPILVKLDQMRALTRDQVIANAELYGLDPVLYLGTRVAKFGRGESEGAGFTRTEIDLGETAGIPSQRLQRLTGYQYRRGLEDVRNAWRNLMFDTGVIRGAVEMQRQMRMLVELVGVRLDNATPNEAALLNGDRTVRVSEGESVVFDSRDYVAFAAGRPTRQRTFTGVSKVTGKEETLFDLFAREVSPEDVVEAGGDYILVPRYMYEAMRRELERITYRPGDWTNKADQLTKQWRNFTLNIFPRTGFANLLGSAALAALGGAGPRSFYLAARYILRGDVPGPTQLRQRFALTLTTEADFARVRGALPQGRARIPGTERTVGAEDPLRALAYWMNMMRRFNGISEDFGRLAVWYSRAFPEASRLANDSFRQRWLAMRSLTETAEELLESFANGDPQYSAQAARFTDAAFEWVGDLHSGGSLNTKLRIAFPFQQWYRHILRLTLITMPLKYPGRTLFLTRLSEIGQEYQREHGILPPWFADVMPFFVEEKMVGGIPQEYILGWRTSNLNPWATAAELFAGGDFNWADYGAGALNPIWTNGGSLVFSMLNGLTSSGSALQVGRNNKLTSEVRDQYGLTIDTYSREGIAYMLNLFFQMLPGNSMVMSMAGQSAEGNFLFGETVKLPRGSEGFFSPEALPSDRYGRDVRQVISDFSYQNLVALLARMLIGGSSTWVTGRGPVEDSQFKAFLRRTKSYETTEKEREANYKRTFENWARIQQEQSAE